MESEDPDVLPIEYALYFAFAAVAGFLGYASRAVEKGGRVVVTRALVEAAGAGFVGMLAMMMCRAAGISGLWTGVIVGVFAWLGANATIRVLERLIYSRLGINKEIAGAVPTLKPDVAAGDGIQPGADPNAEKRDP